MISHKMSLELFLFSPSSFLPNSLPNRNKILSPPRRNACVNWPFRCTNSTQSHNPTTPIASKQMFKYKSSIWDYDFVQTLGNEYTEEKYQRHIEKLKSDVKHELNAKVSRPLALFELIDAIRRLGVEYHFENEIKRALDILYININHDYIKNDLYAMALSFRVFRQNGYEVSPDVFNAFKDKMGSFKTCLCEDVKGMLSFYEASHLSFEGENVLNEAKLFTSKHLKCLYGHIGPILRKKVTHALELPLHWRMQRLEARWYIDVYPREEDMNPSLLELAKLDFNRVQATHQNDLRVVSRWWRHLGIADKMSFARDRLVENFLWSVGLTFEPQYDYSRDCITKVINLILIVDDIYDIYGSLDELKLFTDVVDRWDMEAVKKLPDCMKLCFKTIYDISNEMATHTLKEHGLDILPYLKKVWTEMCKAMLVESKWYNNGYTPSLREYLNNGWISSAGTVILIHAFFATKQKITNEALECLKNNSDIIYNSSMILRLCNDLATSSVEEERGDIKSSIQCYMCESNVSEPVARKYIEDLIEETWKKMNKTIKCSSFSPQFINISINLARMGHCIYQYGDGLGIQDHETKDYILSLLVKSITDQSFKSSIV